MNKSVKTVSGLVIAALVCFSVTLKSQSLEEAYDAYNAGAELSSTSAEGAIKSFEECIAICNQLGEEGDETRLKAEKPLPGLYFKTSMNLYKAKKIDEAIAGFEKTSELAEKYDNAQVKEKADKTIPKLYNSKAIGAMRAGKLDEAIVNYKKAIELNLSYAKAYLGLGMAYKKQNDPVKMEESLNKAIEVGETNDAKTVGKARKILSQSLFKSGVGAIKDNNYDKALGYLTKSLKYDAKKSDAYYYISFIQNSKESWDQALEAGNKAIELNSESSDTEKAKIYTELGKAFAGKGDNTSACEAYKNANYGNQAQNAIYQMNEVLKCN